MVGHPVCCLSKEQEAEFGRTKNMVAIEKDQSSIPAFSGGRTGKDIHLNAGNNASSDQNSHHWSWCTIGVGKLMKLPYTKTCASHLDQYYLFELATIIVFHIVFQLLAGCAGVLTSCRKSV